MSANFDGNKKCLSSNSKQQQACFKVLVYFLKHLLYVVCYNLLYFVLCLYTSLLRTLYKGYYSLQKMIHYCIVHTWSAYFTILCATK